MSEAKLKSLLSSMGGKLLGDESLTQKRRVPSTGSSAASESSSVVITRNSIIQQQQQQQQQQQPTNSNNVKEEQHLRIKTRSSVNMNNGEGKHGVDEEEEEEDDFNDYVIESPLPPPRELHPGKLYALYEFSGDDPSHCELDRDDAVVLLNDQDSYWWLVRKEIDGKIGFAPAECLETYQERLARLNCWKNEELERNSKENLQEWPDKINSLNNNDKSVTFSSHITFTEPEDPYDDSSDEEEEEEEEEEYDTDINPSVKNDNENDDIAHYYNDKRITPKDQDDDNENEESSHDYEANSDVLSDSFPVTPLILKKNKRKQPQTTIREETFGIVESDLDDESPLIQPSAFFSNQNNSGSIGTYSPSSSEFESPGNTPLMEKKLPPTPTLNSTKTTTTTINAYGGFNGLPADLDFEEKRGNIPQSKGTRDIANSMKMLDDLINDELNTTTSLEKEDDDDQDTEDGEDHDVTLTFEDDQQSSKGLLQSPIILEEPNHRANSSNITNLSNYTNSNTSLHLTSTSTSVDQYDHDQGKEGEGDERKLHTEIVSMFQDSLNKMDELQARIRELNSRFA